MHNAGITVAVSRIIVLVTCIAFEDVTSTPITFLHMFVGTYEAVRILIKCCVADDIMGGGGRISNDFFPAFSANCIGLKL